MVRKMNWQAGLELLSLSLFSALLLYLVASGKYLAYVTPKMAPYLCFAAMVMLAWACAGCGALLRPQHVIRAAHCLVLAVPILFLLLPHAAVSASGVSSGYLNGGSLLTVSGGTAAQAAPAAAETIAPAVSPAAAQTAEPAADQRLDSGYDESIVDQFGLTREADGSIAVTDELFYPWVAEIFTNMQRYDGAKITVKGFVFHDPETMGEDEFVPARLLMYCCAADLSPCGIVCEYDGADRLKEDAWVTVTGIIHIGTYQGESEPQITVTDIADAEKPTEEYVYPW